MSGALTCAQSTHHSSPHPRRIGRDEGGKWHGLYSAVQTICHCQGQPETVSTSPLLKPFPLLDYSWWRRYCIGNLNARFSALDKSDRYDIFTLIAPLPSLLSSLSHLTCFSISFLYLIVELFSFYQTLKIYLNDLYILSSK